METVRDHDGCCAREYLDSASRGGSAGVGPQSNGSTFASLATPLLQHEEQLPAVVVALAKGPTESAQALSSRRDLLHDTEERVG